MILHVFRSKTASKLEESRNRFNRLNFKVHAQAIHDEPINSVPGARTNQNVRLIEDDYFLNNLFSYVEFS